jgi:hypothetical protein
MTISAFSTTYGDSYSRPRATTGGSPPLAASSGFGVNNQLSPLALAPDLDPTRYTPTSHVLHSATSSVHAMRSSDPIARAAMERSGFWHDPAPNLLYDSPAKRVDSQRARELNASHLDPLTLRRLRHTNPIEAENGGAGPKWGSTTMATTFSEPPPSHARFQKLDRHLIGNREPTCFTRQHVTLPAGPQDPLRSSSQDSYPWHAIGREVRIPDRTAMEPSGFSGAVIPTHTTACKLTEVVPEKLPRMTIAELKRKNPPEYQNLFNPDPYRSVQQISFRDPNNGVAPVDRMLTPGTLVKRGATGYGSNERVIAGPPGDPREFVTGHPTMVEHFRDPADVREAGAEQVPNVVERSGYWA